MPILFAATLFLSALLLFMVQPMIGRMILPLLGGSPAAWNTCMVFFQFVLLLGYLYAHKLTSKFSTRQQVTIHAGVLAGSLAVFAAAVMLGECGTPIAIVKSLAPQATAYPMFGVLALLAVAVGVPFFAVSTTAPLLQRWFAGSGHAAAKDPYFLYAASNAGSLLSLISYPFITEPNLTLNHQAWVFAAGFAALACLILYCGFSVPAMDSVKAPTVTPGEPPTRQRILKWILLAFVPSSLMLGVTFYMTTDIGSLPLLWIIPLSLYLLTFIIAFMRTPAWLRLVLGNAAPVVTLLLLFVIITQPLSNLFILIGIHLTAYFLLALMCHNELALDRPPPAYLTNFFLWISVGGVLGGIFNALLAPMLFPLAWEYTIALCLACMLVPKFAPDEPRTQRQKEMAVIGDIFIPAAFLLIVLVLTAIADWAPYQNTMKSIAKGVTSFTSLEIGKSKVQDGVQWALPLIGCFFFIERPIRFGLCVAAVVFAGEFRRSAEVFHSVRSAFGILKVERIPRDTSKPPIAFKLNHGTTLHGVQGKDPWPLLDTLKNPLRALVGPWCVDGYDWRDEPLTYYHRTGPVGHLFSITRERFEHPKVAMVGLGTGSVSCYADPKLDLTFFEIDPAVKALVADRVDNPYFTYVQDAKDRGAKIDFVMGDARLMLEAMPDARYDLLMIDAFSSDSIPIHLLTKQALELYVNRITPNGLLALHVSNKYHRLEEVVARLAEDLNLTAMEFNDTWTDRYHVRKVTRANTAHYVYQLAPVEKTQSSWIVLSRDPARLEAFKDSERFHTQYRWVQIADIEGDDTNVRDWNEVSPPNRWTLLKADPVVKAWTDDYADVLMVSMIPEIQAMRRFFGYKVPASIAEDLAK